MRRWNAFQSAAARKRRSCRFYSSTPQSGALSASPSLPTSASLTKSVTGRVTGTAHSSCAFHSSRPLLKPFLPPLVRNAEVAASLQPITSTTSTAYASGGSRHVNEAGNGASRHDRSVVSSTTLHELAVLPIDELVQRVHRFSRTNFTPAQRPLLYAHLREVMKPQRMSQIPIKPLQDFLHLAHVAGLHEACVEMYHAAREHMPASTQSVQASTAWMTTSGAASGNNSRGSSHDNNSSEEYRGGRGGGSDDPALTPALITSFLQHLHSSSSATTGANLVSESAVLVSAFVVDSAYALQSSSELTRMASYCVSQLLVLPPHTQNGSSSSSSSNIADSKSPLSLTRLSVEECLSLVVRSPQAVVTEMALVRCLWRALCLAEYFRVTEAGGDGSVKGNAEQAMADAAAILEACLRLSSIRQEACHQLTAVTGQGAAVSADDQQQPQPSSSSLLGVGERERAELLRRGLHLVRYAALGDDGEFAFYQFCKEEGILRAPQPLPWSAVPVTSKDQRVRAEGNAAAVYAADEVQVFFGTLIETCAAGQLVPEAMLYFTEARRLLGCAPLGDEEDSSAEVIMSAHEGGEGEREDRSGTGVHGGSNDQGSARAAPDAPPPPPPPSPPTLHRDGERVTAAPPPPPTAPPSPPSATTWNTTSSAFPFHSTQLDEHRDGGETAAPAYAAAPPTPPPTSAPPAARDDFTEFLIHRLLFTLQAAKDNRRTVRLARAIIAAGATERVKVNLWTLLLISAGAMRAVDVVLVAYEYAMRQLTIMGGGGGGGGGDVVSSERRTWEYLLQTSLNSLSRCQLPHYEHDYLQPAQNSGVLHCTDEFYFGCLLQDAHGSMDAVPRAAAVLARMAENNVPLTAPLVSRLLKLYLRAETAAFLDVYQHAADTLHLRRTLWTDQLVLWADRRRYFLSAKDRAYIVEEVLRSRNVTDVARLLPMLGGLRAQFALLYYDYTYDARGQFLADGTVVSSAPTVQDSRAHFLTTRALSVQRGVTAAAEEAWACAAPQQHHHQHSALALYDDVLNSAMEDNWGSEGGDDEDDGATETLACGLQPRMIGDRPRRALHAAIAELAETPLLFPATEGRSDADGSARIGGAGDEERLHDEALRVYLADVLGGLQRSLNSVT